MRTLLKATLNVEAANEAIANGSLPRLFDSVFAQLHPEASYFTTENGRRTIYVFFDLADPSQIPGIAEPFFMQLKAEVTFAPVMNRDDLSKGLKSLKLKSAA